MDEKKIQAAGIITDFMGGLAERYNAETMKALWKAMEAMQQKFGTIYVADAVRKDPKDAELALFRYNKHLFRTEPEQDFDLSLIWERPIRWHHVQPNVKRSFRTWLNSLKFFGLCAGTIGLCGGLAASLVYAMMF